MRFWGKKKEPITHYKFSRSDLCEKCGHIFAALGKIIIVLDSGGSDRGTSELKYCENCAPSYDAIQRGKWDILPPNPGSMAERWSYNPEPTYFIHGPEWVEVTEDGKELPKTKPPLPKRPRPPDEGIVLGKPKSGKKGL